MPNFLKFATPKWYNLEQSGDTATLTVDGIVGGSYWDEDSINAKEFVEELNQVTVSRIELHINSPGGDVFAGYTIYNALIAWGRAVPGRTIAVIIDGLAASIASVIAMAGDSIAMPEASVIMIHNPWSFTCGDAEEHRRTAAELDVIAGQIGKIYADRTGLPVEQCRELMNAETYLSADEAVKLGFATEIIENKQAVAACAVTADIYGSDNPAEILKIKKALQKRKNEKELRDAGLSRSQARASISDQCDADLLQLHREFLNMIQK